MSAFRNLCIAAFVGAFPMAAVAECFMPGQGFQCSGGDCVVTPGVLSGEEQEIDVPQRRIRVRATDTNLGNPTTSFAELYAVVVEPDADMFIRANAAVDYVGFLTGFGGGSLNFGSIEMIVIVRDLETNELVGSQRIERFEHDGGIGDNGPKFFDNQFQPPIRSDMPNDTSEGVLLEAGRSYGVGVAARAEARGGAINAGESNYFTANNGVFLNAFTMISWPNPDDPAFADDDGDNLPNIWETQGVQDCDGNVLLPLHTFGADPQHKDLFWEVDWVAGAEPNRLAIATVKESFAAAPSDAGGVENPDGTDGINVWIDTGGLTDDTGALVGDNLTGGNEIPVADIPDPGGQFIPPMMQGNLAKTYELDIDGNGIKDYYEVKARNFDPVRYRIFRYSIFAPDRDEDENDYPGGQGEGGGDDTALFSRLPGTFMHEMGHNLGLGHGGGDSVNCKPNYVSIMNYILSGGGIPRQSKDAQAQDSDNDGDIEARIIDFSPPRFPGGRSTAPIFAADDGLVEATLSENRELDENDPANVTRFYNPDGDARDLNLDERPDWNDDGVNEADFPSVNINFSEDRDGCNGADEQGFSELIGYNDWDNIRFRIAIDGLAEGVTDGESGLTPTPAVHDPDDSDVREIEEEFNAIDLALEKTASPELVMAGQEVTYEITVANNGPNAALDVIVEDTLPEFVTFSGPEEDCDVGEDGVVSCSMDVIAAGTSRTLSLRGRVAPRLPCGSADTVPLVNQASVRNGDFQDLNPADNSASAESEALCLRFEYAAKFVCGERSGGESLLAAPGRYGTIVNIHNPQSRRLPFFKKLALAFPPAEQTQGEVHPIGIDELDPDHALKTDCDDVRRTLFDGQLPEGFIDGYLVVQTPRRLDVDAFYSAGGSGSGGLGIDVEEVTERDLRTDIGIEKFAQVFPLEFENLTRQFRIFAVLYTIRVSNGGEVHGEGLEISDRLSLLTGAGAVGGFLIPEDPFEIPPGASRDPVERSADFSRADFTVNLPEIMPDETVEIRFWALALIYIADPSNEEPAATLVDRAEVNAQGPDTSLIDNRVEISSQLMP